MTTKPLTQARLKKLLSYDQNTGVFTWLVSPCGRVPAGSVAGCLNGRGYWHIQVLRKTYQAHRLAFMWMTGKWPPDDVDHRNRISPDNRWKNLRPATNGQNRHNSKSHGASKYKGVTRHKKARRWQAQAMFNGRAHYLGLHKTEESAAAAYAQFAREHFPDFMRLT